MMVVQSVFFISKIRHVFTVENYLSCRSNEDGRVIRFKLSLASARGEHIERRERRRRNRL